MSTPPTDECDTPLGVIHDADYSCSKTRLAQGDMVLCVSDAFTEASDEDGKMLGANGLLDIVRRLDSSHPETLLAELGEKLRTLNPMNLIQDDATLMLFRSNGTSTSMTNNLLAPLRLVRGVRNAPLGS
jgi:sigma-B regulation protein RsbU (phosphoserine phosphatase)